MEKICIITLGCKVNQYESEALAFALKRAHFEVETKLCKADIYIINSCAVTNEAEHKSREQISKILKQNPEAKIYVCGCSSQFHPEKFLDKPNVECVIGTENKLSLISAIIEKKQGDLREQISNQYFDNYSAEPTRTRGTIKIQDGCNNFCSYCIIPYTRGRERSRELESIKEEVCRLSKVTNEIVLVGINIANYGKDLTPKKDLVDVVNIFKEHPNIRLRFSSFEMGTISDKLLKTLKTIPNFCPFFHISLQSASNCVLKKMNRHYNFEQYLKTVNQILKFFPNAGISTDIIAGFPTETEENHIETICNLNKITFSNIHVFPYSKREGTVAASLPQTNGLEIKKRAKELGLIAKTHKTKFILNNINLTHEVLIEELKNGFFVGFTKNYIKTYIAHNSKIKTNKIYMIKLIAPYLDGAMGELEETL